MRAVLLVCVMVVTFATGASAFKFGGFSIGGGDDKKTTGAPAAAAGGKADDLFTEARRAYGSANYSKVIELTTSAIKESPKFAAAYALRGKASKDMGDVDTAVKDLNRAIELDASLGEAYYIRGQANEINGEMKKAKDDYANACAKGYKDACK